VNERTGKVIYGFRRPFRDGSTHVVLDPMSFLSRLAALVPPPRMHLVTYHGVLAPSARRRKEILPVTLPGRKTRKQTSGSVAAVPAPEEGALGTVAAVPRPHVGEPFRWRRRYSWAELMKRVFLVDVLACAECGGSRRLLAFILEPSARHEPSGTGWIPAQRRLQRVPLGPGAGFRGRMTSRRPPETALISPIPR